MKSEEFLRSIDKGDIRPLYFLYGDESYLIGKGVKKLLSRLVPEDLRDFNLNLYYGNECSANEIVATAQTLPMFAEWRVVLVKNSDRLPPIALETLSNYVRNPSPTTCLLFLGEKIDQRKKFFTEIKKRGELVEFKRLYESQMLPFIMGEAAEQGKKFRPDAAEMLICFSDNNLQELVSQIEKIALYAGDRGIIEVDDVKAVVSDTRVNTVFELANSIGEKNLEKGLRNLQSLMHDGEAPLLILSMLTRHFRQLWKILELIEKRVPAAEIGKRVGVHPYFLQGVLRQSRNFRVRELSGIFEKFFALDLALKSGRWNPALALERLVMEICGNG
ncbi:MAG: DNA polymerase III subunit delta [Deltaproteobacteria bacterium]